MIIMLMINGVVILRFKGVNAIALPGLGIIFAPALLLALLIIVEIVIVGFAAFLASNR